jgi:proteasome alpha subunit
VAENPSRTLRKFSEIYDRIAFAGVGKYNEFDQLRIAGVRAADLKGYSFSREDVDARSLANQYAQILGQVFTHEMKPLEVEILVAEVGAAPADDQLFHLLYDGTVIDEDTTATLGGDAEAVAERLRAAVATNPPRPGRRLGATGASPGRRRSPLRPEVALLDRAGPDAVSAVSTTPAWPRCYPPTERTRARPTPRVPGHPRSGDLRPPTLEDQPDAQDAVRPVHLVRPVRRGVQLLGRFRGVRRHHHGGRVSRRHCGERRRQLRG